MPSLPGMQKENIDALNVVVATVTEKPNLVMHWNGETIVGANAFLLIQSVRNAERHVITKSKTAVPSCHGR